MYQLNVKKRLEDLPPIKPRKQLKVKTKEEIELEIAQEELIQRNMLQKSKSEAPKRNKTQILKENALLEKQLQKEADQLKDYISG